MSHGTLEGGFMRRKREKVVRFHEFHFIIVCKIHPGVAEPGLHPIIL